MIRIIIYFLCICFTSSLSFAGEGTLYFNVADIKNACGNETPAGEYILKPTEKCTVDVRGYDVSEFWVEYRPVGSNNYIKFVKKNSMTEKDRLPSPTNNYFIKRISIPMKSTGEYRVAYDINFNGYPDFYSRTMWLYEAEPK